jgi:hypothetical protein
MIKAFIKSHLIISTKIWLTSILIGTLILFLYDTEWIRNYNSYILDVLINFTTCSALAIPILMLYFHIIAPKNISINLKITLTLLLSALICTLVFEILFSIISGIGHIREYNKYIIIYIIYLFVTLLSTFLWIRRYFENIITIKKNVRTDTK